jgi:hypothetical protein
MMPNGDRLQLLGGEGEELAPAVFVSFDDLALFDFLAGSRWRLSPNDRFRRILLEKSGGQLTAKDRFFPISGEGNKQLPCRPILPPPTVAADRASGRGAIPVAPPATSAAHGITAQLGRLLAA